MTPIIMAATMGAGGEIMNAAAANSAGTGAGTAGAAGAAGAGGGATTGFTDAGLGAGGGAIDASMYGTGTGLGAEAGAGGGAAGGAGTGLQGYASEEALRDAAFGANNTTGLYNTAASALSSIPQGLYGPLAGAALGALSGSQDSTTTNSTQVNPALADFMQRYRDLAAQTSAIPFEAYTGQRAAGLTGTQQAAGSALQGQVDNIPALREQINGLVGQGTSNLSAAQNSEMDQIRSMLNGLTEAKTAAANPYADMSNPYLQGAVTAANRGLVDNYNTVVAPKYSQGSSFGNSGLAEYEVLERENLARQLSDNANTLSYQGYQQAANLAESYAGRQDALTQLAQQLGLSGAQLLGQLGESQAGRTDQMATGNATRQLQGAQILGNSEQQYASLINNLLGYGNQEQATNQAGLDAQYEEFLRRIGYPAQQLGILGQGLAANPGGTSTSTTPGNTWTGAAGGALLGAQVQRLLNQPTSGGSNTTQQVISSPTYTSPDYSNLFQTQNSKSLFGTTVGG